MKLSRFRRKNFTPLKKRKSSKRRRQIKRRPTKKFNIGKTHNMRGGTLMAILNTENTAAIKDLADWPPNMKSEINEIQAGISGIEYESDSKKYVIHTTPYTRINITKKIFPNIYEQVSKIYNDAATSGLMTVEQHHDIPKPEHGQAHDGERNKYFL